MQATAKIPKVHPVNDRVQIYRAEIADGVHELRAESTKPSSADFDLNLPGTLTVTNEEIAEAVALMEALILHKQKIETSLTVETSHPARVFQGAESSNPRPWSDRGYRGTGGWTPRAAALAGIRYQDWSDLQ